MFKFWNVIISALIISYHRCIILKHRTWNWRFPLRIVLFLLYFDWIWNLDRPCCLENKLPIFRLLAYSASRDWFALYKSFLGLELVCSLNYHLIKTYRWPLLVLLRNFHWIGHQYSMHFFSILNLFFFEFKWIISCLLLY